MVWVVQKGYRPSSRLPTLLELGLWWNRITGRAVGCTILRRLFGATFFGVLDVVHDLDACRASLEEFEQTSMRTSVQPADQRQRVPRSYDSNPVADPTFAQRAHDTFPPLGGGR